LLGRTGKNIPGHVGLPCQGNFQALFLEILQKVPPISNRVIVLFAPKQVARFEFHSRILAKL
jgi:hypothetical protein